MKHLISFLSISIFTLLAMNLYGQKVVELQNGEPVITADKGQLAQNLQANLKTLSNLQVAYDGVTVEQNDEGQVFLVFSGSEYRTTIEVARINKASGEAVLEETGGQVSCTSKCCSDGEGCKPSLDNQCTGCECDEGESDCVRTTISGTASLYGDPSSLGQ